MWFRVFVREAWRCYLPVMHGTFPSQEIEKLVRQGCILASSGIAPEQIQPSSLDLTLSVEAYSMTGSLLPLGGERVRDLIERFARYPISLREPAVLVRDNVYLVRLRESMALPAGVAAYANNKSSTGRIDLQTRVICDKNPRYDKIPEGYSGELWLEVIPKSFDVKVRTGDALNQAIIFDDRTICATRSCWPRTLTRRCCLNATASPLPPMKSGASSNRTVTAC